MSSSSSSPMMSDLFATAREDAPSGAVRDAVWGRVAATTALPAAGAVAAKAATLPAAKLLALGAVIGAVGAVLAVSMTSTQTTPTASSVQRVPAVVVTGHAAGARLADPTPRARATMAAPSISSVQAADWEIPSVAASATPALDDTSGLAEEARLVTEARTAIMRGEPERALALARSTRKLRTRMLEPEELALEARALRALGRTDEALATELTLRRKFPEHALSR